MTRRVRLHPAAIADLRDALAWYDRQSPGLGRAVLAEMRRVIERIRLFPYAYRQLRPGIRQAALPHMPLHIIYSSTEDDIIIVAVPHTRREPASVNRNIDDRTCD